MRAAATGRTPTSFWTIAVLSLLWNAFGAFDFTMTNIRNQQYLAQFPPGMMDYIDGFPIWALAAWAAGVWGALAGSLLLLARSRLAIFAFAVSLIGLALSSAYQWSGAMPAQMGSPGMVAMSAAIWIVAIFLLGYAVVMQRTGTLR